MRERRRRQRRRRGREQETTVVDRAVWPGHKRLAVAPGARTGRSVQVGLVELLGWGGWAAVCLCIRRGSAAPWLRLAGGSEASTRQKARHGRGEQEQRAVARRRRRRRRMRRRRRRRRRRGGTRGRTGQDRTGQDRTGQDRTGQDRTSEREARVVGVGGDGERARCWVCIILERRRGQRGQQG
ncbi:hypothetical protein IWX46DRAFT_601080 [Phyllosticta citricarpa]|uniref:Uncharacterized protein n=1 Tax=Phyllosticta citricarpa TaxID=55181 RepID=A0ABR1MDM1_9PEZI